MLEDIFGIYSNVQIDHSKQQKEITLNQISSLSKFEIDYITEAIQLIAEHYSNFENLQTELQNGQFIPKNQIQFPVCIKEEGKLDSLKHTLDIHMTIAKNIIQNPYQYLYSKDFDPSKINSNPKHPQKQYQQQQFGNLEELFNFYSNSDEKLPLIKFYQIMENYKILETFTEKKDLQKIVKKEQFSIKGMQIQNFVNILMDIALYIYEYDQNSSQMDKFQEFCNQYLLIKNNNNQNQNQNYKINNSYDYIQGINDNSPTFSQGYATLNIFNISGSSFHSTNSCTDRNSLDKSFQPNSAYSIQKFQKHQKIYQRQKEIETIEQEKKQSILKLVNTHKQKKFIF